MTKLYRNTVRVGAQLASGGTLGSIEFVDDAFADNPLQVWQLERRQSTDNLVVRNAATGTDTAWFDNTTDTFHVQQLAIEGSSAVDAGTLDGLDSAQFVRTDVNSTVNATLNVTGSLQENGSSVLTAADEGALDAGTLDGLPLADVRPSVSDDGTQSAVSPADLNFGQYLQATDDGDGTVTINGLGGNAVGSAAIASGDGDTATFTLPHNLGATPESVVVTPLTEDAMADWYLSDVRTDSVDITYVGAPTAGTDNLSWYVTAFGDDGSGLHQIAVEDDGVQQSLSHTLNFGSGLAVTGTGDDVTIDAVVDTFVSVSDDGAQAEAETDDIDFGDFLDVTADGAGGVTVDATGTYPSVSSNADVVSDAAPDLNFTDGFSVVNDGDGTVSIHGSSNAQTLNGYTAAQFLRADADTTQTATLGVTTLRAATGESIDVADGHGFTAVGGPESIRVRRTGLKGLTNGASLPTDAGLAVAADATIAFIEPTYDDVAGWVDTNDRSLTMPGGVRVGDAGGQPAGDAAVDARGDIHVNQHELVGARFENRTSDPVDPAVGQFWVRTDVNP